MLGLNLGLRGSGVDGDKNSLNSSPDDPMVALADSPIVSVSSPDVVGLTHGLSVSDRASALSKSNINISYLDSEIDLVFSCVVLSSRQISDEPVSSQWKPLLVALASRSLTQAGLGGWTSIMILSSSLSADVRVIGSGVDLPLATSVYLRVSTSGVILPLLKANLRRSGQEAGLGNSVFWHTNPRREGGLRNIGLPIGLDISVIGVILPLQLETMLSAGLATVASSPMHLRGIFSFRFLRADLGLLESVPTWEILATSVASLITLLDVDSGPSIIGSKDARKHRKHIPSNDTFP